MKKRAIWLYCLVLLCLSKAYTARATYVAAGNVTYTWLGDSTYRVLFKLYSDCAAGQGPDSVSLCTYNVCTNSGFTTTMHKVTGLVRNNTVNNGTEVPVGCNHKTPSKCTDPNATLPGRREWWYADTVTLPSRCASWQFRVALNSRNTAENIVNGHFLVGTIFNNTISHQNSSPTFSMLPTIFVCENQPYNINMGATDADGDSLSFSVVQTKTAADTLCGTTVANIAIKTLIPIINYTTNPFQTNNTFMLGKTTGQLGFTTTLKGNQTFTVKTDEYRNGVLIGSMMADMQVYAFDCSNIIPLMCGPSRVTIKGDSFTGCDTDSMSIRGCAGTPFEYQFYMSHKDTATQYVLHDSIAKDLPGATISYSRQGTDSVRIRVRWTPTAAGRYSFRIFITDTACRPPISGFMYMHTKDIFITGGVSAGSDMTICSHEPAVLSPKNGLGTGSYTWQMLPGSTGSISCSQCDVALGWPAPTARYVVTSATGWCNSSYSDTVDVTIGNTAITYPIYNISVSPDSNVWEGLPVTFTANISGCAAPSFKWMLNGDELWSANAQTFTTQSLVDGDVITCRIICADSCPNPRDTVSNSITMKVAMAVAALAESSGKMVVYPNPAKGVLYVSVPNISPNDRNTISITDMTGRQVIEKQQAHANSQVDISTLPPGVYLVFVHTNDRVRYVAKMVKQ